jgi:hypothetical protein
LRRARKKSFIRASSLGNLRQSINEATSTADWLGKLFSLCGAVEPASPYRAILAIDTPLGFPTALVDLLTRQRPVTTWNGYEIYGQPEAVTCRHRSHDWTDPRGGCGR